MWLIGVEIKAISALIESRIGGVKYAITASSVSENGGASVVQEDFELAGPVCEYSKNISIGGIKVPEIIDSSCLTVQGVTDGLDSPCNNVGGGHCALSGWCIHVIMLSDALQSVS